MIGIFDLRLSDWVFDYVKDRQPKEYYEDYMIDLTFIRRGSDHPWSDSEDEEKIQLPLLKLGKIKKSKKYYYFESDFSF